MYDSTFLPYVSNYPKSMNRKGEMVDQMVRDLSWMIVVLVSSDIILIF